MGQQLVWERVRRLRDSRRVSACTFGAATAVVELRGGDVWIATVTLPGATLVSPRFPFRVDAMDWAEALLRDQAGGER